MNDALETHLPIILRKDSGTEQSSIMMAASSEQLGSWPSEHTYPLELGVLAMCSGAALDVVTCALLRYNQKSHQDALNISILEYQEMPVAPPRPNNILNGLQEPLPKNANVMTDVHTLLGDVYSSTARAFMKATNRPTDLIHLITARADSIPPSIAPHVSLTQNNTQTEPARHSWTAVVAARTGVTTTTNLAATRRPVNERDESAGLPLESLFLQHPEKYRVCLHIGELMSLTIIPPKSAKSGNPPPTSFCGPGTLFINYVMRYVSPVKKTDEDGTHSRKGKVYDVVVNEFLRHHDYSVQLPSLSIATEMYGTHEVQDLLDDHYNEGKNEEDMVATITRITAENILRHYNRLVALHCPQDRKIEELFICGPGARNMSIVDYLEDKLPKEVITRPVHDVGIPDNAMEVLCCAQLGLETILKHARDADGPFERSQIGRTNGVAVKGQNWDNLREHIMRFSGGKTVYSAKNVVVRDDRPRR